MRDDRGDQEIGSAGAKRPAAGEGSATIQSVHFTDGGAGRLWLNIDGEARLSELQLLDLATGVR